ncbi:WG repeat-containing protein [Bremerella sp. JC817]|uniref:WG repeat-containing protein n=1 Tax=Bremerella sp. JC817 TaxID=3231756 RepID=UPI00345A2752
MRLALVLRKSFEGFWKPTFKRLGHFIQGRAFAESQPLGTSGFIDHTGKFVIEFPQVISVTYFTHDIAWMEIGENDNNYGYMGSDGQWIWQSK